MMKTPASFSLIWKYLPVLLLICSIIPGNLSQIVFPGENEISFFSDSVVRTSNGPVRGVVRESRNPLKDFVSFEGLRYARTPARFEMPRRLEETWVEPLLADKPGNICAQVGLDGMATGDEDCLFLNVYVPQRHLDNPDPEAKKLPVMFFVHGGGYAFGAGYGYGAEYFMENEDVILVTVNYRLGVFGFLATGEDDVITGNNGLRDLVQALRWVQENIAAFKGDPDNVTVFGQSAGSTAVHYLMMSHLAKGLFHRVILMSGTFCFWAYDPTPKKTARDLAMNLRCDLPSRNETSPIAESLAIRNCLANVPSNELTLAQAFFKPRWPVTVPVSRFVPTGKESVSNAFFASPPQSFFTSPSGTKRTTYVNKVPVIVGMTRDEGALLAAFILAAKGLPELNEKWNTLGPTVLLMENFFLPNVSAPLREFYFGNRNISEESMTGLESSFADVMFRVPIVYSAMEMIDAGMTVWPYRFSYDGGWSFRDALKLPKTPNTIAHADEMQYLFPHPVISRVLEKDSEDEKFSKKFIKLWTSFAKNGKPELDPEWAPGVGFTWNAINPSQPYFAPVMELLDVDKMLSKVVQDFSPSLNFWRDLVKHFGVESIKEEEAVKANLVEVSVPKTAFPFRSYFDSVLRYCYYYLTK